MARVKTVNLVYHFGDSLDEYAVIYLQADGVTPVNLSSYTATLKIKSKAGPGATTFLTLASGDGLTVTGAAGRIDFSASPTKMTSGTLVQGTVYYYDLQVATAGPTDVKTLIKGEFWVDAQVTD